MKVAFYNLGCKVNLADISRIGKSFEELGHNIVEFGSPADVTLINTCTVTHRADADCRKVVRKALKISPNSFVGVMGCYAQLSPREVAKINGVDAVFGQKEKYDAATIISKLEKQENAQILVSDMKDIEFHTSAVSDNAGRTRAILKLQDGCNYHCTFCTIPMARGESRSMRFDDIEGEIEKLAKAGYKEVVLSGVNLGDYKDDEGRKFADALRKILSMDFGMRFRISSIEPNLLKDDVLEMVANSDNMCKHFHIPLQSGSPEILRKMKRRYQAKDYHKLILNIKDTIPECCIGADVIVGFPGETDQHFQETYDFISTLPISYLHAFTYSERPGTPASEMSGVVSSIKRKERVNSLRDLSDKLRDQFDKAQVGITQFVIPETYNPDNGLWKGWTGNYVTTYFAAPSDLAAEPLPIKLVKYEGGKMFGVANDADLDLYSTLDIDDEIEQPTLCANTPILPVLNF